MAMKRLTKYLAALICLLPLKAFAVSEHYHDFVDQGSNTFVHAITPDTGTGYEDDGGAAATVYNGADYAAAAAFVQSFARASHTPASADYWAEIIARTVDTGANDEVGVAVRLASSSTSAAGYIAVLEGGTGVIHVRRSWDGSDLFTETISGFSASTDYRIRIQAEGTGATVTVSLWVDDVEAASSPYSDTDASRITSVNDPAFYVRDGGGASTAIPRVYEFDTGQVGQTGEGGGNPGGGGGSVIPVLHHQLRNQ